MNIHTKFIKVLQIIYDKSSNEKYITSSEIKKILKETYNTSIDTRTIRNIVTAFNKAQNEYEIEIKESNNIKYRFLEGSVLFLGEAKAIVDLVHSSNFFTLKTKNDFTKRMKALFSEDNKKKLEKRLDTHVCRNESSNSFFFAYEEILKAMATCQKISFQYLRPHPNKLQAYTIKEYENMWPIETSCDNNTFYLYCYDQPENKVKSFRIDFIKNTKIEDEQYTQDERIIQETKEQIINSTYGYSSCEIKKLKLTFPARLYPNIIDKFGKERLTPRHEKDNTYSVTVDCPISDTFYS